MKVRDTAPELRQRVPRVLVGVALTLPVLLVVGVLLASDILDRNPVPTPETQRLALPGVSVPAAASADCARLISGLPAAIDVGGTLLPRRVLAEPAPAGTVAWGGDANSLPIVLRCGLPRPPELTPAASLLDVDGVDWVAQPAAAGASTWVTADRSIFVGLTVPDGVGSGPIQDVSRGVKITLASQDPAPTPR